MTRSVPALALSLALLGLVAWMATAHPGEGRLFAPPAAQLDAPVAPTPPSAADDR